MKPMHTDLLPTLLGPLHTLLNRKADKTEVIKTINGEKPDADGNAVVETNVIQSSTEGSTKKFKIAVDDSGTITATEVT